jgi:light-harvesting complex I chlorophyll a/b binding protein 1
MVRRLALLAVGASPLLAPAVPGRQTALRAADAQLDGMIGTSIECGDQVWDPLELSQWRDAGEMRACELANGRAAMLGWVGWLWPQVFGLWKAGPVTTTDPIDAVGQVPTVVWCQIIVFCGAIEANKHNFDKGEGPMTSGKTFFDPFGLYPADAAGQEKMQLRELKNARVAMIGIAGLFVNHFMSGAVPGLGSFH